MEVPICKESQDNCFAESELLTPRAEDARDSEFSLLLNEETNYDDGEEEMLAEALCDVNFALPNNVSVKVQQTVVDRTAEHAAVALSLNLDNPLSDLVQDSPPNSMEIRQTRSPYEETPVSFFYAPGRC